MAVSTTGYCACCRRNIRGPKAMYAKDAITYVTRCCDATLLQAYPIAPNWTCPHKKRMMLAADAEEAG